jgi:hypothetical protein
MSNYLCGLGRAVGFTGDTASRGPHGEQGGNEWDVVSHASSHGGVNLLNRPCGLGQGQPPRGGDRAIGEDPCNHAHGLGQGQPPGEGDWAIGDTLNDGSPAQRDRQQPGEGRGDIPGAINRDNAIDIQSNVSMEEGYDLRGHGEGQDQHQAAQPPGKGIAAQLLQATTCNADATIEKELDWQARVEGGCHQSHCIPRPSVGPASIHGLCLHEGQVPGDTYGTHSQHILWHVRNGYQCARKINHICGGSGKQPPPSTVHTPSTEFMDVGKGMLPPRHGTVWQILPTREQPRQIVGYRSG